MRREAGMFYECPNCGEDIEVGNSLLGKTLTCPICAFAVPALSVRTAHNRQQIQMEIQRKRQWGILVFCLIPILLISVIGGLDYVVRAYPPGNGSRPQVTATRSEPTESQPEQQSARKEDEQPKQAPEPSTLVLLGAGAIGAVIYAWRRRRTN